MTEAKQCSACGEIKLLEEFYRNRRMKDGYTNKCKACTKAYYSRIDRRLQRNWNLQIQRAFEEGVEEITLTLEQWTFLYNFYDGHCAYCGSKLQTVCLEHITPFISGGSHTVANVVPSCIPCNSRKCDKSLEELGWVIREKEALDTALRERGWF